MPITRRTFQLAAFSLIALLPIQAIASPLPQAGDDETTDNDAVDVENSTREIKTTPVRLAFEAQPVMDLIPFIVETTGKVVIPINPAQMNAVKITLVNDVLLDRQLALNLVFEALARNKISVNIQDSVIFLASANDSSPQSFAVISADEDIMARKDFGSTVVKIFKVKNVKAEGIVDQLDEMKPENAVINFDPNSNQVIVRADIRYCQQVQRILSELDDNYVRIETRTFRLRYADAAGVYDNILELFEEDGTSGTGARTQRNNTRGRGQTTAADATPGPNVELRVTVNSGQNSVTVRGAPDVIEQIADHINNDWDLPRPEGTTKVYTLRYTDPIKVRDTLNEILGGGSSSGGTAQRGTPGARGGAGSTDVGSAVSGIYKFEAFEDANALVAICKTEQSLIFLDDLIDKIDQPSDIGLPLIIPLAHADAVNLAEELNVLLSDPGSGVTLPRPEEGLTGTAPTGDDAGGGATQGGGSAGNLQFPWQNGGRPSDEQAKESSIIGKVRIVPIIRQNALAILAPPSHRDAMRDLIEYFDRPGRQVMISVVIAEVELTDDLALGLRFSDGPISSALADGSIGGNGLLEATIADALGSDFATSLYTSNTNVNVLLQALKQKTNVRILQQPIVFTGDNEEAIFFDGQDVPIIDGSNTTPQGGTQETFTREPVGVFVNVRPRITAEHDVDLDINLEISSVVDGVSQLTVVDRRQTTTKVIVQNNQTIAISGIIRDEERRITRKIPLLGEIPLIGELFTSRENSITRTELIAFITPTVVENPSDSDELHRQYIDRIDSISRPLNDQADRLDQDVSGERIRRTLKRTDGTSEEGDAGNNDGPRPMKDE